MGTSRYSAASALAALTLPWVLVPGLQDGILLPKCLLAALCLAAGAACWLAAGAPSLAVGLEGPLSALLLAAAAAAALSVDRPLSLYGVPLEPVSSLYGLGAGVAALYLGAATGRGEESGPGRVLAAFLAGSVPVSLLALVQASDSLPGILFRPDALGRAVGTFGHPVALGAYLCLVVPAALAAALRTEGRTRTAAASIAVLAAAGLAASGTRAGWGGAAVGAALVLWLDGRPAARKAALAAALAGLVPALGLAALRGDAVRRDGGRAEAWALAWRAFGERPFFGQGPATFGLAYRRLRTPSLTAVAGPEKVFPHAHNDWFEVLAAAGLAGAAAYGWLHATALGRLREAGPGALAAVGAAAGLFVFAKANLPPLPVLFLAGLLVGSVLGGLPAKGGRAAAAALFLACAGWTAWCAGRRLPADRAGFQGRAARAAGRPREAAEFLEASVRRNPEVLAYRLDLMNLLWDGASSAPPEERSVLLSMARDLALAGVRLRPAEPEFLRLLGLAELRRSRWAGADSLPAARSALEAARALDPLGPDTRRDLAALANPAAERLGGAVR